MASDGTRAEPAHETDADLLVYMSMAGDDASAAGAAWEEFHRRHAPYLYAVCLRAYGPMLGGPAGAADLVADTLRRAFEHADKFDAGGLDDPDRLRRRVRAWLGRIAQRLAQSLLRGRRKLPTVRLEQDHWQQVAAAPRPRSDSARVRQVRRAIAELNEREQMVIRVTFQYYQPGREHQRLPNDVAAELAETLATTPENLRQIRRRALRKIETFLRGAGGEAAEGRASR
jgi:RNA polymerase sigma factor (sigma-70 family)